MATDAMILTAARDLANAVAAVDVARTAYDRLTAEYTVAARVLEEAKVRATEAERRLLNLSRQKPTEPPPQPSKVLVAGPNGGLVESPNKVGVLAAIPNEMLPIPEPVVAAPPESPEPSPDPAPRRRDRDRARHHGG